MASSAVARVLLAVLALQALCGASALYFKLGSGDTKCIFEDLGQHVPATVTYKSSMKVPVPKEKQTAEDPATFGPPITITVRAPKGRVLLQQTGEKGKWNYAHFEASEDGAHQICFTAGRSGMLGFGSAEVNLEVVTESGIESEKYRLVGGAEEIDALQQQVNSLIGRTRYIHDEQDQIKNRWESHLELQDSTLRRVMFSAIMKAVAVGAIAYWQSSHMKRFLKKKKVID
eukprot:tig00000157_g9625.t1